MSIEEELCPETQEELAYMALLRYYRNDRDAIETMQRWFDE